MSLIKTILSLHSGKHSSRTAEQMTNFHEFEPLCNFVLFYRLAMYNYFRGSLFPMLDKRSRKRKRKKEMMETVTYKELRF